MKNILFLLALWFVSPAARAQDFDLFQKKEFISERGDTLRYRILYPEKYDASEKYPVVLLLHGGGERGSDNTSQLKNGAALFLKPEHRRDFPCIVIAPQCPANSYWASVQFNRDKYPLVLHFDYGLPVTPPLHSAIDLLKKVVKKEGGDKKRVYITGLSMGGMGTFEAVYRYPKLFAAAMPICGGGDLKMYSKKAAKVPFRIFHGDVDGVIEVKNSREMVQRLKELGADVQYMEYPGVNHNSWENAFAEPDFLSWMFSRRR